MSLLILAACWLLFGASHSLLAGHTLERAFGRHARLAFNAIAVLIVTLPLGVWAWLPAQALWSEPEHLRWIRHGVTLLAGLGFVHTLRY
ncbi:MAG TPA: hypothetical protein PKV17_14805, partial [Aquabacterium sp.]|nr:hypothetical protein [Aquabacterium sp.]